MEPTTFIYILKDPRTRSIRYVGKADNPQKRLGSHLADTKRNAYRVRWINSLKRQGLKPILEVIDEVLLAEWEAVEREYIRVFRLLGMKLVNTTDGGDGPSNPSPEVRWKISQAHMGKKVSPETRAKLRAFMLGKRLAPHHAERLRTCSIGLKRSEETKARMRSAMLAFRSKEEWSEYFSKFRGRKVTQEIRAKLSESHKGKKHSAETKAKMSAAHKGRRKSPETRARMSIAQGRIRAEKQKRDKQLRLAI